jgi:hypothetical protein
MLSFVFEGAKAMGVRVGNAGITSNCEADSSSEPSSIKPWRGLSIVERLSFRRHR